MILNTRKPYIIIFLFIPGCWFIGQGLYVESKALLAQQLLQQAWEKVKAGEPQSKPWPWADTWPVARLSVPRLDIDLIVLAGDSGRTLAFGPGHHFASALPGEAGNSLISAHRDTHFEFLQYLQPGDRILIETPLSSIKTFKVTRSRVVDMDNARFFDTPNQATIHFVTCYPFNAIAPGGAQRYIVSAIAQDSR
jgi:sortase A